MGIGAKSAINLIIKQSKLDPTGNIFSQNYKLSYKLEADMDDLPSEAKDMTYDFTAKDDNFLAIPSLGKSIYPTILGNVGVFTNKIDWLFGMEFRAETLSFSRESEFPGIEIKAL